MCTRNCSQITFSNFNKFEQQQQQEKITKKMINTLTITTTTTITNSVFQQYQQSIEAKLFVNWIVYTRGDQPFWGKGKIVWKKTSDGNFCPLKLKFIILNTYSFVLHYIESIILNALFNHSQ
jgi:hypothetical protein